MHIHSRCINIARFNMALYFWQAWYKRFQCSQVSTWFTARTISNSRILYCHVISKQQKLTWKLRNFNLKKPSSWSLVSKLSSFKYVKFMIIYSFELSQHHQLLPIWIYELWTIDDNDLWTIHKTLFFCNINPISTQVISLLSLSKVPSQIVSKYFEPS